MELNHLRHFHEVAKAGSFTAAARALRVSQSALSKAVALLEASAGAKLLVRSKKGVALTEVGKEVYQRTTGLFQLVLDIENTCRGRREVCEGPLRFGASDHITNYLLTQKLFQMRKEHPRVVPSIFSGTPHEIITKVLAGEIEFGLFISKVEFPEIYYEEIGSLPMAVVCIPNLLPKGKVSFRGARLLSMIKTAGLIGSIRQQYQRYPSQDFMNLVGPDVPIVFESNSQEAQKRYCLAGGGVAYLARFMVAGELTEGTLVEIPTPRPFIMKLHMAKKRNSPISINAREFLRMFSDSQALGADSQARAR